MLDSRSEELLAAQLRTGHFRSPEEVIARALETLAEKQAPDPIRKSPAEAVAHIRASRRGVTLAGLKIRDLIHQANK
jgi:uncharacterized Fe-S cluster-containing radical SAM superfamily protein